MAKHNSIAGNDKVYRLNFQIVLKENVAPTDACQMISRIQTDLNETSLSLLLASVVSAKVQVTQKVLSYSVFAVDANQLREFEKYEAEEEERKSKKRKREQVRRAKKKEAALLLCK